jgi:hypothetical protein
MYSTSFARFGGRMARFAMLVTASLPGLALAVDQSTEEQKLVDLGGVAAAGGGKSVAISDDGMIAVVGAPTDGNGAAYVYTRNVTLWTEVATLRASDAASGDQFGASVSISGDITHGANIAVGAPGRSSGAGGVYLFSGNNASWTQNVSSPLTSAQTAGGHLGSSVSVEGFRIAAGAPNTNVGNRANVGVTVVFNSTDAAHLVFTSSAFRPNGGQSRNGGLFGTSVSLSGSTVLVGAPGYHTGNKQNSGNVFVFVNNGGGWTQQASIRPANVANNFAGTSVSLFSNTAAFGAPGNSNNKGAVYVYNRTGTSWSQTATVTAPGGVAGDQFGTTVSQLGQFLIAGTPFANSGGGAAYEFGLVSNAYTLLTNFNASDNAAGDAFGTSIDVNSGRAIVGAPNTAGTSGAAYVFKFLQPDTTVIDGTSDDPNPSLTGVAYTVNLHVDGGGAGTPTGSVNVDDSNGGNCTATLDGTGHGSCQLTSNFFGALTLNANYGGDLSFSPSTGHLPHTVTGNHLVFNPAPPLDIPQGDQFVGTIQVQNGGNALISSNNTTQVMLTLTDSCGTANAIGPVTAVNGVATFNAIGPRFYTLGTSLTITAQSENDGTALGSANINIVANPTDFIFAGNFDVDDTGCPPAP